MNNEHLPIQEKRRNPRFPIDAIVTMIDKSTAEIYSGICCDVSANGLLVQCAANLSLKNAVHLQIKEIDGVFLGNGSVVRKTENADGFLIGFDVNYILLAEDAPE